MSLSLPNGSNIKIDNLDGHQLIVIPHGNGGFMRFIIAAFLLFWLGGWFMGFTSAIEEIVSGKSDTFLIFWLGGWTIGGLFAVYMIYRVLKKSIPEKILLNKPELLIDTGIPPLKIDFGFNNQKDYWKSMFPKRKRIEFNSSEIKSIALREIESGNRLTLDKGSERIELACSATEIEREWLFDYLQKNYL